MIVARVAADACGRSVADFCLVLTGTTANLWAPTGRGAVGSNDSLMFFQRVSAATPVFFFPDRDYFHFLRYFCAEGVRTQYVSTIPALSRVHLMLSVGSWCLASKSGSTSSTSSRQMLYELNVTRSLWTLCLDGDLGLPVFVRFYASRVVLAESRPRETCCGRTLHVEQDIQMC